MNIKEEAKEGFGIGTFFVVLICTLLLGLGAFKFLSKPARLVDKVTEPDHIISSYEEFYNSYESVQAMCTKIDNLNALTDVTSGGFSKEERLLALKDKLARIVSEYNANSKKISKNMWKPGDLPHTININSPCNQDYETSN